MRSITTIGPSEYVPAKPGSAAWPTVTGRTAAGEQLGAATGRRLSLLALHSGNPGPEIGLLRKDLSGEPRDRAQEHHRQQECNGSQVRQGQTRSTAARPAP